MNSPDNKLERIGVAEGRHGPPEQRLFSETTATNPGPAQTRGADPARIFIPDQVPVAGFTPEPPALRRTKQATSVERHLLILMGKG